MILTIALAIALSLLPGETLTPPSGITECPPSTVSLGETAAPPGQTESPPGETNTPPGETLTPP